MLDNPCFDLLTMNIYCMAIWVLDPFVLQGLCDLFICFLTMSMLSPLEMGVFSCELSTILSSVIVSLLLRDDLVFYLQRFLELV